MILDTTVLVDLQRELQRSEPGAATALLERFLSPFPVLWPDIEVSWEASRIARRLAADGRSIGDHDAWIAAFGLRHGRPVVSRNDRHFSRVPGLEVRSY